MITELTKAQEEQLSVYRSKYIKLGLNTERIDREQCIKDMQSLYEKVLKRKKAPVIILDNPYHCWLAVNMFCLDKDQVRNQVRNQTNNRVYDQVYDQVLDQLSDQVKSQVRNQVSVQVNNQVKSQVKNRVKSQVKSQVRDQVNIQAWKQVKDQNLISYISPYFDGSFDSYMFSTYDYMLEILNIKIDTKLRERYNIWKSTMNYGQIYPLDDVCIVSEKPLEINLDQRGRLHADLKPALKYAGNFNLWYLNGINVPEWLVTTKKENLDVKKILELKNVDQRAQGIKKLGIEYMEKELKEVEKGTNGYVLYDAGKLFDKKYQPVLKMKNPSVPLLNHLEFVHPDCKTIQHAINWRYSKDINKMWNPGIVT